MADPRTLGHFYDAPPIVEAVIELRFSDQLSASDLQALSRKLGKGYASAKPEVLKSAKIDFAGEGVTFVIEGQQTRLSSADEVEIAVVKANAFSVSRLAPYLGWESFHGHVERDLRVLLTGRRRKVERIGVRYINRIDVPITGDERVYPVQFFNAYIHIPEGFQGMSAYNFSFETTMDHHQVIVQSGRMEAPVPSTCAFSLDLDVIAFEDVPQELNGVLERLSRMREVKNSVFEMLITSKARELFKRA